MDVVEPADRSLVLLTRNGETDAYGALVRRYQTSVFNVCYRIMGERGEAEDMTQEAFLRGYQRLHRYDLDRPFGPWIRRVAANLCLNRVRDARRPLLTLDEEIDSLAQKPGPNVGSDPGEPDDVRSLREAIRSLPSHYRVVIELRHFHGMTYDEIAAAIGASANEVRSHLYRARRLLAGRMRVES
jgi:RNA polymerase sigma-70 factor (ECF subfamily)